MSLFAIPTSEKSLPLFAQSPAGLRVHNLFSSHKIPTTKELEDLILDHFNVALQSDDIDVHLNFLSLVCEVLKIPTHKSLAPKAWPLVEALVTRSQARLTLRAIDLSPALSAEDAAQGISQAEWQREIPALDPETPQQALSRHLPIGCVLSTEDYCEDKSARPVVIEGYDLDVVFEAFSRRKLL